MRLGNTNVVKTDILSVIEVVHQMAQPSQVELQLWHTEQTVKLARQLQILLALVCFCTIHEPAEESEQQLLPRPFINPA
ncbi:hypothetical protein V2J09_007145 [Rumex salicifolius]